MVRTIAIAAFWALAATCAQAGEYMCAQGDAADTVAVSKAPANFVSRCVRLRGMLGAVPKAGALLTAVTRPGDAPPPRITVYFDSDDGPPDLSGQLRFAEIVGRVLGCGDIWKNAMDAAKHANEKEKKRAHATGELQTVSIATTMGTCHYRGDAFAILISRYRFLAAPPPGRAP
jgi:hypothetical protein